MNLLLFLIQVFVISISGAMQPGPVTATAITMGSKNRWAGVLLAVGHGIIEFPLMLLIILGLGSLFQKPATQITIGLIGGIVLLYMALSMFKSSSASVIPAQPVLSLPKEAAQSPKEGIHSSPSSVLSSAFYVLCSLFRPLSSVIRHPSSESITEQNNKTKLCVLCDLRGKNSPILAGILLTASNPYFLIWWATVGLALATRATQFGLHAFVLFAVTHWLVDLLWVTALSFAAFHGTSLLGPKSQTIILKLCSAAMLLFALFFLYNSIYLLSRP